MWCFVHVHRWVFMRFKSNSLGSECINVICIYTSYTLYIIHATYKLRFDSMFSFVAFKLALYFVVETCQMSLSILVAPETATLQNRVQCGNQDQWLNEGPSGQLVLEKNGGSNLHTPTISDVCGICFVSHFCQTSDTRILYTSPIAPKKTWDSVAPPPFLEAEHSLHRFRILPIGVSTFRATWKECPMLPANCRGPMANSC